MTAAETHALIKMAVGILSIVVAVLLLVSCVPEQGAVEKKDYDHGEAR